MQNDNFYSIIAVQVLCLSGGNGSTLVLVGFSCMDISQGAQYVLRIGLWISDYGGCAGYEEKLMPLSCNRMCSEEPGWEFDATVSVLLIPDAAGFILINQLVVQGSGFSG